ncbi:hypothetical protein CCHR01_05276 [Colletotrichum chrysophilum]|uniref:Uncharacterized protein n=1 Tax=Colletotrichum chrysophilum TaxID=1836956 RepID=A0AAD9EKX4_9PEZI|nr:hypothetical protein CCHR01_05276 [Colletotrichum chrysophilum]
MVLSMMTDQQRQRPSTTEIGRQSCEHKYGLVERGRQDDDDVTKTSAVATCQLTPRRDPLIRNPPVSASLTLVLSSYRSIEVSQSHHTPTHIIPKSRTVGEKSPKITTVRRLALDEDTDERRGGDIHTYLPDPGPNIGHVSRVH